MIKTIINEHWQPNETIQLIGLYTGRSIEKKTKSSMIWLTVNKCIWLTMSFVGSIGTAYVGYRSDLLKLPDDWKVG